METVEKIKHFRQLQHLIQEQMAEQLCISPNTYGSIERGETELTVPRLIKIAAIFQIPPSVLLDSFSDQFIFNSFNIRDNSNSQNLYASISIEQLKSKYEIEKQQIIIEQKEKEITHLNEQEFWALMAKLTIEQDRRYAEQDRQHDLLEAQLAKTDAKLNKVAKLFGDMNNNRGAEAEEFFFHSLRKHPRIADINFDTVHRNLSGEKGKISDEFDLVLVNGDSLALIEVKTKAHLDLVDKMIEKKIPHLKILFPHFKNYKIYAGIASLVTYPDLIEKMNEKGLFLLTQQGKHLEMINPPLQHW